MNTLKGLALPLVAVFCPAVTIALISGHLFICSLLLLFQFGVLAWVTISGEEDEFVKQSRKLWKNIKGVF